MPRSLFSILLTVVCIPLSALPARAMEAAGPVPEAPTLGPLPGDPAPPLTVSRWVRGAPIARYEPGRVYVIDMWATWCRPCLSSMPRLAALEAEHPEDLTVVAMDVWEMKPDGVPAFVGTHGDSMPVRVAMDSIPPGKDVNEGLTAVAFTGDTASVSIPRTYLVDRSGRIAWIGLPQELDEPLSRVLTGSWDVASFAERYRREMQDELKYRALLAPVEAAVEQRAWARAYEASEAAAAADSSYGPRIAHQGFTRLAGAILRMTPPSPEDLALARRSMDRAIQLVDEQEWPIYELAAQVSAASGDVQVARAYLDKAVASAPEEQRERIRAAADSWPTPK